jgi:hypothetical protein
MTVGTRADGRPDGESGVAAVEFAVVLPVLLLLLFGIVQFGMVFVVHNAMTYAAQQGARVAAVQGDAAGRQAAVAALQPWYDMFEGEAAWTVTVLDCSTAALCPSADDSAVTIEIPMTSASLVDALGLMAGHTMTANAVWRGAAGAGGGGGDDDGSGATGNSGNGNSGASGSDGDDDGPGRGRGRGRGG